MAREVAFVPNQMLPVAALPDIALPPWPRGLANVVPSEEFAWRTLP
ncbi:hypothetical protein ACCUM_0286 [Candidatus Accumulibacter phosphatis]|nr:hypothetical protein ACCUM_0286 [Candidatus Accumulibacter phosphatis]